MRTPKALLQKLNCFIRMLLQDAHHIGRDLVSCKQQPILVIVKIVRHFLHEVLRRAYMIALEFAQVGIANA